MSKRKPRAVAAAIETGNVYADLRHGDADGMLIKALPQARNPLRISQEQVRRCG